MQISAVISILRAEHPRDYCNERSEIIAWVEACVQKG
jgi:hypothetical protein